MSPPKQIPVLFVRGTHYQVGYEIGRQFKDMITSLVSGWTFFNKVILPTYATNEARNVYETSLKLCRAKFPQYMKELEGISAGSGVAFEKIFLLHIDSLLAPPNASASDEEGCTSILCTDPKHPILGHTEDASWEFLDHIYIVDAEILDEKQRRLEKFCSLAYAGHLPGYTMGYNSAGLIYTINTLCPAEVIPTKTPRNFLTRALLAATTFDEILTILKDTGSGTSDGFSVNLIVCKSEGATQFELYNIEVAPSQNEAGSESDVNVVNIRTGGIETGAGDGLYAHCNRYLRISIPEIPAAVNGSSFHRHKVIDSVRVQVSGAGALEQVKTILSDTSDAKFPIYRCGAEPDECATLAVGIFDLRQKTWSIYLDPPCKSSAALILPLHLDNSC